MVRLGKHRSDKRQAFNVAVPQGSRLGPVLFNFTINDIFDLELFGVVQMFADDAAIKYSARSLQQLQHEMAHDIRRLEEWFALNRLEINPVKSKYMIFSRSEVSASRLDLHPINLTINNEAIERVRKFTYLGVVLDDKLNWSEHIDKIRREIIPYVFALYRIRPFVTEETALMIYNAHIASRLMYVAPAWRTATQSKLNTLTILQRSALKSIKRLPRMTPSSSLYSESILDINMMLEFKSLVYLHSVINDDTRHTFDLTRFTQVHSHNTRNNRNFVIPRSNCRLSDANILQMLSKYNDLPNELKTLPPASFKRRLRCFIFENSSGPTT